MERNRKSRPGLARSWILALLISVVAVSLISHLQTRYPDQTIAKVTSAKCGCLQAQFQYLEREAVRWLIPSTQANPLPPLAPVARVQFRDVDLPRPASVAYEPVFKRPPPTC